MEIAMWLRRNLLGAGTALLAAPGAQAQDIYPNRPVRIVVAFPAGGSVDIVARLFGAELAKRLGQPFVVDNRSGAGGVVGTEFVAKSAADGYTLLMAGAGPIVTSPALNTSMPFDSRRDLTPITLIALQPNMVIVHPSLPVTTIQELIAYARANPGRINYATAGIGSSQHLSAEAFALRAGITMTHIPYRGGAPALSDLVAGQVQAMFETIPTALGVVRNNQARALAVTTINRSPSMPDLPTVAEQGVPDYEMRGWLGLLAPGSLPPPMVTTLDRHVREIMQMPDIAARLVSLGLEMTPSTPASFGAFLDGEMASNRALVVAANITLN